MAESNKKRICVWMSPSTLTKIDSLLITDATVSSRGELIEKAVEHYKSHRDFKEDTDYLAPIIKAIIENTMNVYHDRLNRNLFKQSTELSILTRCIAKVFEIDKENYDKIRLMAVEDVKRTKGTLSILDAQDRK